MNGDLYYCLLASAPGADRVDLSQHINSFNLDEERSQPARLGVELDDRFQVLSRVLGVGLKLELELGSTDDHSLLFCGQVLKVESSFTAEGTGTLKLTAYDDLMQLGLQKRKRAHPAGTLMSMLGRVILPFFQDYRPELLGNPKLGAVRQKDETDLAFLGRMAGRYGCAYHLTLEGGKPAFRLYPQARSVQQQASYVLSLSPEGSEVGLTRFEASFELGMVQLPVEAASLDTDQGQAVAPMAATSDRPARPEDPLWQAQLNRWHQEDPEQARQLKGLLSLEAESLSEKLRDKLGKLESAAPPESLKGDELKALLKNQAGTRREGMRCQGAVDGLPGLHVWQTINIFGVGSTFSGKWFLTKVTHRVGGDGYTTEFEAER